MSHVQSPDNVFVFVCFFLVSISSHFKKLIRETRQKFPAQVRSVSVTTIAPDALSNSKACLPQRKERRSPFSLFLLCMYIFGIIHNGVIPNNAQHVERKRAFFVLFFLVVVCLCVFLSSAGRRFTDRYIARFLFCFVFVKSRLVKLLLITFFFLKRYYLTWNWVVIYLSFFLGGGRFLFGGVRNEIVKRLRIKTKEIDVQVVHVSLSLGLFSLLLNFVQRLLRN